VIDRYLFILFYQVLRLSRNRSCIFDVILLQNLPPDVDGHKFGFAVSKHPSSHAQKIRILPDLLQVAPEPVKL